MTKTWRCTADPNCPHDGMICCGEPAAYTEADVALVARRLADERGVDPELQARRVLDDLAEAGLLITPRIQRDTEWLGRAYIWRRPDGKPVVLNPMDVDVVLPQEPT